MSVPFRRPAAGKALWQLACPERTITTMRARCGSVMVGVVASTLVVLGGCSATPHAAKRSSSTTLGRSPKSTTTIASSTTTTGAPGAPGASDDGSGSPSGPAGGPVPVRFTPVSFTAISEDDYWVLGTAPCRNPVCTSIVRTTDGGGHFVGIPAPVVPLAATNDSPSISDLRFADPLDGFAYGFSTDNTGAFYATHDGGTTWHPVALGDVLAFGTGRGTAYAVTAQCSSGMCAHYQLRRSPVSQDSWSSSPLPLDVVPQSAGLVLAVYGPDVWIMATTGTSSQAVETLARSSNGGSTFTEGAGPCTPGLPGDLEPSSDDVIWAYCATGTSGRAYRSSDGGASFTALPVLQTANSALIAQVSATTALVTDPDNGSLLRTVDAGATWTTVGASPQGTYTPWIGFTDATTGAALVESRASGEFDLWRTSDAGGQWSETSFGSASPTMGAEGSDLPGVIADCTAPAPQAQQTQIEPTSISLACADDGEGVEDLVWTNWTPTGASGKGEVWENNCTPDCAGGTIGTYPASVALTGVDDTAADGPLFTQLSVVYQGPGPSGNSTEQFRLPEPPE